MIDRIQKDLKSHAPIDTENILAVGNNSECLILDSFTINSLPRDSVEEAKAYFWLDYFRKVKKEYSDIYWRRMPEISKDRDYNHEKDLYSVRCRFSLVCQ